MRIPFALRRRTEPAPAVALLLPAHQSEELLRLLVRLGEPLPLVYTVADGFLVKLARPLTAPVPGVVRLRSLADNLLLPVDAELVPGLLADEAEALARHRGLIFLPGGRVLEFAPQAPVPRRELLGVTRLERRPWQPLPEPPALADRLEEITLDRQEPPPDAVLEAGGADIGTEVPRPPASGLPAKVLGKAVYGLGQGMAWLGRALHVGWLARAGARSMAAAMALVPRLSESLLGRQEAALRELLKDFRAGKVEQALRRALPIGGDTPRGSSPDASDQLPTHRPWYSLQDILGGDGPGSVWFNRSAIYQELEKEYRRQAERATAAGDYRRAAFIYGKLLQDFRLAAGVLAQGGLHRDAAIIYLMKLGDELAAAREFEAAGEIDRALHIYRQRGEHELAGDLLRRAGEEDMAIAEYQQAAVRMVATGRGHYNAAEMLLRRAGRPDLALGYYQAGWERRPAENAIPCALRLAQLHTQNQEVAKVLGVVTEAEQFFRKPGNDSPVGVFFNEVARLADAPALAPVRDDLRDRALTAIAGQLRQGLAGVFRPRDLVSTMLAQSAVWTPALVCDADFAVKAAIKRPDPPMLMPAKSFDMRIRARIPMVRAVCWAPVSADIFLGFESGEVFCYRPQKGEVIQLPVERIPVTSLATDDEGQMIVVGRRVAPTYWQLASMVWEGMGYRVIESRPVLGEREGWLCPLLARDNGDPVVGVWIGEKLEYWYGPRLLPTHRHLKLLPPEHELRTALLFSSFSTRESALATLTFPGFAVWYFDRWLTKTPISDKRLGWAPSCLPDSSLKSPSLSWLRQGPECLELAGVDTKGNVYWSELEFQNGALAAVTTCASSGSEHYLAAAVFRAGLVAAITPTAVQWLRKGQSTLNLYASSSVSLPGAVACFPYYQGHELIVVSGDGTVSRVPLQG